ncbi:MAG: Plug domain-containing protein, partial [Planctomycetales bacterium]
MITTKKTHRRNWIMLLGGCCAVFLTVNLSLAQRVRRFEAPAVRVRTQPTSPSEQNPIEAPPSDGASSGEADPLFDLTLAQLGQVVIAEPVITLTPTRKKVVPAAVTRITAEDVQRSGARSLNELLEIYVPNLQWVNHFWESSH